MYIRQILKTSFQRNTKFLRLDLRKVKKGYKTKIDEVGKVFEEKVADQYDVKIFINLNIDMTLQ